jgi:hypothetical protein
MHATRQLARRSAASAQRRCLAAAAAAAAPAGTAAAATGTAGGTLDLPCSFIRHNQRPPKPRSQGLTEIRWAGDLLGGNRSLVAARRTRPPLAVCPL